MAMTFEEGFAEAERAADNATKSAARLAAQAKAMQKAAKMGDINAFRRAVRNLETQLDVLVDEVAVAEQAWPFDENAELSYLQDGYVTELKSAADSSSLNLTERDGQLVCSPSIVRVQPGDRSVRIDRKRLTSLRPSALVAALKANQQRPTGFRPERFLEMLAEAYGLLVEAQPRAQASNAPRMDMPAAPVIQLEKVYAALTLQPGSERDYSRTDFARDLYLLDSSGVAETRKGARVSFPASTGTRGGKTFHFVTPEGEVVTYYGIRFAQE